MISEKHRVAEAFSGAAGYESAATIQAEVAARLARRIAAGGSASRILEIGCGTGLLSRQLAARFPGARLTLTDLSEAMLQRCANRLGPGPDYRVMDGEAPDDFTEPFDLIASSLAMQWFTDLPGSIARLARLLAPGGRLVFATLGERSFVEWRQAHAALGLACGLHDYPGTDRFPVPAGISADIAEEMLTQHHSSGRSFVHALKAIGAATPRSGHHPLAAGPFRRLLRATEAGFTASYHILYVEITNC